MRGKPALFPFRLSKSRITPADAGKTHTQRNDRYVMWDHPRGCGENLFLPMNLNENTGSPPRMRGKRQEGITGFFEHRITPADAGKTALHNVYCDAAKDHPRGCGENQYNVNLHRCVAGSPPRMRGKLIKCSNIIISGRITPADAGKTWYDEVWKAQREDHPRGCGENRGRVGIFTPLRGSPPRMRGKRSGFIKQDNRLRITPADAGKTVIAIPHSSRLQDHPRGCGENCSRLRNCTLNCGITPADAGKTGKLLPTVGMQWDHPRGCGENFMPLKACR